MLNLQIRAVLESKKREIGAMIKSIQDKIDAIDSILDLFDEGKTE